MPRTDFMHVYNYKTPIRTVLDEQREKAEYERQQELIIKKRIQLEAEKRIKEEKKWESRKLPYLNFKGI